MKRIQIMITQDQYEQLKSMKKDGFSIAMNVRQILDKYFADKNKNNETHL